jgi:hypothetical protein
MRIIAALILASLAGAVAAKLPPPSAEAKALSAETAAKAAWTDKVGLYQLCQSMDRTAEAYRKSLKGDGKAAPAPTATPACVDPGPYVSQAQITPATSKPLEAAGAHSPPGNAISPPSTTKTQAEISKSRKP